MNPSVNRSSDSPNSSDDFSPEVASVPNQPSITPTGDDLNVTNPASEADSIAIAPSDVEDVQDVGPDILDAQPDVPDAQRQQPIPPPSEPMQYRAIGLIRGQYMPSAEQLTRGTLLAADGTLIDAVLLGRVMSLVKNHLSLDQPHLWVVYPRSRQEDGNLHVQIVGVWEPEKLNRKTPLESTSSEEVPETPEGETPPEPSEPEDSPTANDGYFSIRGEVIFHSREEERVIVKIKQSPRKEVDKIKFFKLKLNGLLGENRVVGHFWDLHVQLQANALVIQEGNDIGMLPAKKRPKGGGKRPPFNKQRRPGGQKGAGGKKNFSSQRPMRPDDRPATATPPKRREPPPKPVKRTDQPGGSSTSGNSSNS
jgi:hypothetical protein